VLSQEGLDTLLSGTYAIVSSRLRKDLLGVLGASRFPRRIRYVREIPVNEQGKTTAAAARAILDAWCQEPAVSSWKANDRELEAKIVFPPDAECFNGHFPEFPILPGVAQLFFIRYFASQVFHDFPQTATYRRLKFQKIVLPSKEVVLSVVRKGEEAFSFSMSVPTGLCSSGLIERTSSL
jgi:3-hydroxymyristoyl/3-hydroxydecanoyl-(acyl carrier protein) dehydratase